MELESDEEVESFEEEAPSTGSCFFSSMSIGTLDVSEGFFSSGDFSAFFGTEESFSVLAGSFLASGLGASGVFEKPSY